MRPEQEKLILEFLRPNLQRLQQQQAKVLELEQLISADEQALAACEEQVHPMRNACLQQIKVVETEQKKLVGLQRVSQANQDRIGLLIAKIRRERQDLAMLTAPPADQGAPLVRSLPHMRLPES